MKAITRRSLLATSTGGVAIVAIPLTGKALHDPAAAAEEALSHHHAVSADDTPILRLFRTCQEIRQQGFDYVVPPGRNEDAELERLFWRPKDELEDAIMAAECRTPADFAAKLIVDTGWGGFEISDALWRQAQNLTGFRGPLA